MCVCVCVCVHNSNRQSCLLTSHTRTQNPHHTYHHHHHHHVTEPRPETSLQSVATPPMKRPKSSQSDLAMSASSDGSPIRRPRPHSVAGRLPSYASPTVSSQIRMSRDSEKKSSGNLTVCYRFSKFMLCHRYFTSASFHFHHRPPSSPCLRLSFCVCTIL